MRRNLIFGIILGGAALASTMATADPGFCPPGLAKKNPPCVPPGLAKKAVPYGVGDRIDGGYIILRHPRRFGLDPKETYYRVGDYIFRVDRETREVLDFIGAAAALLD
mgnify:FL=1